MKEEMIQTLHPTPGKTNKRIALRKYNDIRENLLQVLEGKELTHTELMEALYDRVKDHFEGGVQWYGETVKLDLEARNILERTKTKPEKYRLTRLRDPSEENAKPHLRTCPNGHSFLKSSDCPTCPICEELRKPKDSFLALIGAPARRALEREGIDSLEKLATYTEKEILELHGMGKSTLPKLKTAMESAGLMFKQG